MDLPEAAVKCRHRLVGQPRFRRLSAFAHQLAPELRGVDFQPTAGDVEGHSAVATEGMKRCPYCGMGNLVTDATCASCGKRLPDYGAAG
jgi:hypothetical protein